MKKIEAIFKPFKLDEIKEALRKEKIRRFSFSEVHGAGCDQIRLKHYRGVAYTEDNSEVSVAVVVEDDEAGSNCSVARNDASFRRALRR